METVFYKQPPYIQKCGQGENIFFGEIDLEMTTWIPQCTSLNCKNVADRTVNCQGLITNACAVCAKSGKRDLIGVYCRFCYKYRIADIPWSSIPFAYICRDCDSVWRIQEKESK
jgi:hypothetical protein